MIDTQILRTSTGKFRIAHFQDRQSINVTILNFLPLINKINSNKPFCLAHWRPEPKGEEAFGIYDSESDKYYSINHDQFFAECPSEFIAVPVVRNKRPPYRPINKPSACILYWGRLSPPSKNQSKYLIENAKLRSNNGKINE